MEHNSNVWENIFLKMLPVISLAFFPNLGFIFSVRGEDGSFRFYIILTMPPDSIVNVLITGQGRVDTAGTLEGSTTDKTDVKKLLNVVGQYLALIWSLFPLPTAMEVGEKQGETDCENLRSLSFFTFIKFQ